jgi:hypothetical protein
MRLQPFADRDPVQPGHVDVEHDQVRLLGVDGIERGVPVGRLTHFVVQGFEASDEKLSIRDDVVHDEDDWRPRPDEAAHAAGRA